jgi:Glyoxalase/Bleomycin resistance protein/Dioxygenase superfamily
MDPMSVPHVLPGTQWDQIGIIVPDLDAAVEAHAGLMPGAGWRVFTYDSEAFVTRTYRRELGRFTIRLALSDTLPQVELIQSLSGPNIYEEWILDHGYGPHHVGMYVPSLDDAIGTMGELGYEAIQIGRGYGARGDGGFAYFDTSRTLGTIIEFMEKPERRRPADRTLGADDRAA